MTLKLFTSRHSYILFYWYFFFSLMHKRWESRIDSLWKFDFKFCDAHTLYICIIDWEIQPEVFISPWKWSLRNVHVKDKGNCSLWYYFADRGSTCLLSFSPNLDVFVPKCIWCMWLARSILFKNIFLWSSTTVRIIFFTLNHPTWWWLHLTAKDFIDWITQTSLYI